MELATLDPAKSEALMHKLLGALNGVGLALGASLGHRTGLFDAMAEVHEGETSVELAARSGLSERYIREWLGAMVTSGVVDYDAETRKYHLPAEHAMLLTRAATPNNMAAAMQFTAVLAGVEDRVLDAFRDGKGVPYCAFHRFHEVMAEESAQTVVAALDAHILPLVPGLVGRLEAGIDALDVGCGSGRAINHLAARFPASRFLGLDVSEQAIGAAREEADRRGLGNARFETRDAAEPLDEASFDLITAFDAIHDQPRPAAVLRNVRDALRPGGVFLMQDISGSGRVERDVEHPLGTFLYVVSLMHCMSVSLAGGGPGLGAMWGQDMALRMLGEAGFGDVRVESLPHDLMNFYYVAQAPQRAGSV